MTQAVLFDLDGTFADTAPDLAYALNRMRESRDLPPLPLGALRPVTSTGARGMLGVGFGMAPGHPDFGAMKNEFLDLYERNLCRETRLFPGTEDLLAELESRGIRWGIVTNKSERYAVPLMDMLGMAARCACVIGGDTTPNAKPHPGPLLEACHRIGVEPSRCLYAGDDERDVVAGRAAGMRTVAVRYGYLNGSSPDAWGADAVIDQPQELIKFV